MTNHRSETPTWPAVCVTGHRIKTLRAIGQEAWVRAKLFRAAVWLRDERGTTVGLSGMAVGTDQWWAEAVLAAGLTLGAYVPSPQQPNRWPDAAQLRYHQLLTRVSDAHSHITSLKLDPSPAEYTGMLHLRNRQMIDAADAVLAVWFPGQLSGGTWQAVTYAHRKRKPGMWVEPGRKLVHHGLPDLGLSFTATTPALPHL